MEDLSIPRMICYTTNNSISTQGGSNICCIQPSAYTVSYSDTVYMGTENPWKEGFLIQNAVPGYWEDMTEAFASAPFFRELRINPEFGAQRYPISGSCPDMALPNIVGNFLYRRTIRCCEIHGPAVLHFEGVQNAVSLWLNGTYLGRHEGYSTPFDFVIPEGLLTIGENTIVLSISNYGLTGYDGEPISGLTNRAACQYTGGITGDVELREYKSPLRDGAVLISEDLSTAQVRLEAVAPVDVEWAVLDGDKILLSGKAAGDFTFNTQGLSLWSPEVPKLYTLKITCLNTVLTRSFGLRRLTVAGNQLLLNGRPCYLRGITEHCYYPETVHPPHDLPFYRNVIRRIKELGFNFIRFHTYIPPEEYLQAADEEGILVQAESPNNTTLKQWQQIVSFCRRHTSVVIYCCGNELPFDEDFIVHLNQCADAVHRGTDALFSPMSAMRGVEYFWSQDPKDAHVRMAPIRHHPPRLQTLRSFCDVYNSFTLSHNSYKSLSCDPSAVDSWDALYQKPRLSHEICIHGVYADLSLESRYQGTPIGKTALFSSVREHLQAKGLLEKAPLYFQNSSQWQRRLRKHCFESTRLSQNLAGYDFLGPIDTHWHTFGYDVGMMNEFYELKPGETIRNVRMYNSATVLLTDLNTSRNFTAGKTLTVKLLTSHYGPEDLKDAQLSIRLALNNQQIFGQRLQVASVKTGKVTELYTMAAPLPQVNVPGAMKLYVTLECGDTYAENEWELYLFPETWEMPVDSLLVSDGMDMDTLLQALDAGKHVLLLGAEPFSCNPTSFQMALAGRSGGNLATVIADHPALSGMPHDGFCGWQFRHLLEDGQAICFETDSVPFDPIVEVVSTHKFAIRQSALFEFQVGRGKLLVCSFRFSDGDPAACWLKNRLIAYASGNEFQPRHAITEAQLRNLANSTVAQVAQNTNVAMNLNDKTAVRRKKG